MGSGLLTRSLVLLAAVRYATSATYSRSSRLTGQEFVDAFTWQTDTDPNYGRVNYIDYATAHSQGLVSVSGNQVTLRADSTSVLNASGAGRNSFDLLSNAQYTTHVAIFDVAHMPEGCGTWPAIWSVEYPCLMSFSTLTWVDAWMFLGYELGDNWPYGGEIDILEGINNQAPDSITLHTSPGCTMPASRPMTGTSRGTNCNVYETDNTSCGVTVNSANSYGPSFNAAGGGWYVIERTPTFIKVFFWSRNDPSTPQDVLNPGSKINTDDWGTPAAYFPSSNSCDFSTHLTAFNIVIDLDFCGAWAGNAQLYHNSGCPSTCADFVNSNPSAFEKAFFTFNALNIYE